MGIKFSTRILYISSLPPFTLKSNEIFQVINRFRVRKKIVRSSTIVCFFLFSNGNFCNSGKYLSGMMIILPSSSLMLILPGKSNSTFSILIGLFLSLVIILFKFYCVDFFSCFHLIKSIDQKLLIVFYDSSIQKSNATNYKK